MLWIRRSIRPLALSLVTMGALAPMDHSRAAELSGTKSIVATTADGTRIVLGSVSFTPTSGGESRFTLAMDREVFTDYFLSMREFKCIPAPAEVSCHVPYPYENPRTVSVNPPQFAWLEHSLLFLYKKPSEFGAKLWNGIYFEFQQTPSGLVGKPQAVDLNAISGPPKDPNQPPFRRALRDDMPAQARWIRALSIE